MGGNEKSAKGCMAKENIAKGYINKATTRPEGRSLRAPKWDDAKNRPKGTSARRFSARGYMTKGTKWDKTKNRPKFSQRVHQQGVFRSDEEFVGQKVYE